MSSAYQKGDHILVTTRLEDGEPSGWHEAVVTIVGPRALRYTLVLPDGDRTGHGAMWHEVVPRLVRPLVT